MNQPTLKEHALEKLRKIILEDDLNKIQVKLEKKLGERPSIEEIHDVIVNFFKDSIPEHKNEIINAFKDILPEIILESQVKNKQELIDSISTIFPQMLNKQIKEDSSVIVDALFPVIGAIIAKYIGESTKELTDKLNQRINDNFTFEGVKRKLKSKMTGVSESDLILGELYSENLEAIYLIHTETGLIINELVDDTFKAVDSDLFAGMLTAIKSFSEDTSKEIPRGLNSINYGEYTLYIENTSHFYLAFIILGSPNQEFKQDVRLLTKNILDNHANKIINYDGSQANLKDVLQKDLVPFHNKYKNENSKENVKEHDVSSKKSANPAKIFLFILCFTIIAVFVLKTIGYVQNKILTNKINNQTQFSQLYITIDNPWPWKIELDGLVQSKKINNELQNYITNQHPNSIIENKIKTLNIVK